MLKPRDLIRIFYCLLSNNIGKTGYSGQTIPAMIADFITKDGITESARIVRMYLCEPSCNPIVESETNDRLHRNLVTW